MAKNKISEFSSTAADNTDITNINIAEGCSPSNLNNAVRSLMAVLKSFEDGSSGDDVVVGGNLRVTGTTTLVGTAIAPTPDVADNSTKIATTAFVTAADTAQLAANNTWTGTQTFIDNKFEVVDNADATKKLNLQLSGVTTATTRTLTVPDKDGTIATTSDFGLLNASNNTVVSGSYAVTSSATITITATNTFSAGQTVFIQFTNTSGSSLTNGNFTIVTASGSNFTINYGSSVTSSGTCISTRYGLVALATATDLANRTDTLRAVTSSNLIVTRGTLVTTTSGTTADFTGIPSWVKRITVMFNGVSTTGSSPLLVQLGTGGSPETSGYLGTSARYANGNTTSVSAVETAGFSIESGTGDIDYGTWVFTNITGNTWICSATVNRTTTVMFVVTGTKSLSGVLNMVRVTTLSGTPTFDAGSINILYE